MPIGTHSSQDFLKFITVQSDKEKFGNLEMLMAFERSHPGMFMKVMSSFEEAKSYRECLDENGKPKKISWEEALKKFYLSNKYVGVTTENLDIAELLASKGIPQKVFEEASSVRRAAQVSGVLEHILGKPVKEETLLESIEGIRTSTEAELGSGREMIEELYEKQFTYEWLSKNDPHNSIMGLFCSCCGSITSSYYGKDIANASVRAPDVQNIVVRDSKGDIISKGTMYVNRENGYAVINDFELNERYKQHERSAGRYEVEETSEEEQAREMIFRAFQRGIRTFVKEYDTQNPDRPLNQINIGMGYNRLKRQVEQFKKATTNLTVPAEYNFRDAMAEQYILYERARKQIEKGDMDR